MMSHRKPFSKEIAFDFRRVMGLRVFMGTIKSEHGVLAPQPGGIQTLRRWGQTRLQSPCHWGFSGCICSSLAAPLPAENAIAHLRMLPVGSQLASVGLVLTCLPLPLFIPYWSEDTQTLHRRQ